MECIRCFYDGEDNPLQATLSRYEKFFNLFGDFKGYCEFFLLQDLVERDYSQVRFFTTFIDFKADPLPVTVEIYRDYMAKSIGFVIARNQRIRDYAR